MGTINKFLKGVNLGGWLVLERWMTANVFEGTDAKDEYTLTQTEAGRAAITKHHETYIQESDFAWLKANNITAVRIPVGHWLFESVDNYVPHIEQLDWAMDMARIYDLDVLIDLHGLKGSQNGLDHSGKVGKSEWFEVAQHRDDSIDLLERIARRYADHPKFWGLQVINEPFPRPGNQVLRTYYKDAAARLKPILKHTRFVFSDAFVPRTLSGAVPHFNGQPAVMDVHIYQPFKPWITYMPLPLFFAYIRWQKGLHRRLLRKQSVIIGEWSGVIRHEDLEKIPELKRDAVTKRYIDIQLSVYSATDGWFYWSYKTEGPGTWNYRSLVEAGVIT